VNTRKYDHVLNLKVTKEMLAEIDAALSIFIAKGLVVQTRSSFLRSSVLFALESLKESEEVK
jgi:hypothetical protein